MQRGLATRKLSVRLSVRLSGKRVDCDQTEERFAQIFTPYERTFTVPYFYQRRKLGERRPTLREILGQVDSFGAKSPIFSRYSLVAPQP